MIGRFRRDPAFTDTGPPEPPGELLTLRANHTAALATIDALLRDRPDPRTEDALLEVRGALAPAKAGSSLMRPVPVIPGRAS